MSATKKVRARRCPPKARVPRRPSSSVEDDAHVLEVDELLAGLAAHDLDGVLVAEEVAALDGVVGVLMPIVAAVGEGRVDAALCGVGVAADGIDLGEHGDVGAGPGGLQRRAHTGQARAEHQHIM